MKLLKVFGVVVGIHVFALVLIFANPGCSSAGQPPAASDTIVDSDEPPAAITVNGASGDAGSSSGIDADTPAITLSSSIIRYSPTRPDSPAAHVLEAGPIADVTPVTTYSVRSGDSLWTIARRNHLTVSDLAAANNIKAGAPVRVGQKLIIPAAHPAGGASKTAEPAAAKSAATNRSTATSADSVKHVVKAGETLGAIARKYQVKMGDLATVNNIADPARIRPGMELIIPGWQAPASHGARSTTTRSPAPASPAPETPTISVGDQDAAAPAPASDSPPVISVEDVPPQN